MRAYAPRTRTGGRVSGAVAPYRSKAKVSRRRPSGPPVPFRMPSWPTTSGRARYSRTYKYKSPAYSRKVVSHAGNGSTKTSYTSGTKRMSRDMYNLFKNNQEYIIGQLSSQRIDSNSYGRQFVGELGIFNAYSSYTDMLSKAMPTAPTLNERYTSTVHVGTINATSTFTNQEATTSYLTIYEIEPRFHMPSSFSPTLFWQIGLQRQTDTTTDFYTYVYEKPFKSHQFCCYFKVTKSFDIELAAGQSHKHESTYHINKALHGCIPTSASVNALMRGFTKFQLYVASGTPINDSNVSLVGNVSTSTIAIDVVNNINYNFTYAPALRAKYSMSDGMAAIVNTPNVITQVQRIVDTEA